jgi:hypothetical protein
MMTTTDDLIRGYLHRLDGELKELPRERRGELLDEIREHIDDGMADLASPTEADVRNLLDRVGDPTEIAAEARERFGVRPPKRSALDVATLILLPVGGVFIPVLGWVVGVIFLWISEAWNRRDKLIGTLLLPGGLALPGFLMLFATSSSGCVSQGAIVPAGQPGSPSPVASVCPAGPSALHQVLVSAGVTLLILIPIATAVYLGLRLRARTAAIATVDGAAA